jgi:phospholipid/cholesterol/gamma-HCH transport system substrate-binding protein
MTWRELSTELKVGLFVVVCVAVIAFGWVWSYDGLRRSEGGYHVQMVVPSADGLYPGSLVKIAGVDVGAIDEVTVEGNRARLLMSIKSDYPIPTDTTASLRSSGMLGDRYVGLDLGSAEAIVPDGGTVELAGEPYDIDAIAGQVEDVTTDVSAMTAVLREMLEDETNRENVETTLANVSALSAELRTMAEQNRQDVAAIVDSVSRLTASLETYSAEAAADLDKQFESLATATEKLDATLAHVESITGKIDRGEGTLGALVNDDATIEAINETVENANGMIESYSGMYAEVYYLGRAFMGSQPDDPAFFYGNPVAPPLDGGDFGAAWSNNLGFELHTPGAFWLTAEINDYPQGPIRAERQDDPAGGTSVTEYTRGLGPRFTLQMSKRWWDVSFRLGIKESSGGGGVTGYLLRNRLMLSADVFDFTFGSYPVVEDSGLPNLRLAARLEPIPRVWLEGGAEQVILGARYGYFTGFVSAGFHFSSKDI